MKPEVFNITENKPSISHKKINDIELAIFNMEGFPDLDTIGWYKWKDRITKAKREIEEILNEVLNQHYNQNMNLHYLYRIIIHQKIAHLIATDDFDINISKMVVFKEGTGKVFVNISRAFNLGLIDIDFENLTLEEVEKLNKELENLKVNILVKFSIEDAVLKDNKEVEYIEDTINLRIELKDIDNYNLIEKRIKHAVGIKDCYLFSCNIIPETPVVKYYQKKMENYNMEFLGTNPKKYDIHFSTYSDLGAVGIKLVDYTIREIHKTIRKYANDKFLEIGVTSINEDTIKKIKDVAFTLIDNVENYVFKYINSHPFNAKQVKKERLKEILKENGKFFHIVENEYGSAYKEPSKDFTLIYTDNSISDISLDLKIYRYRDKNIYFVNAVKSGITGYNFGYFVLLNNEENIEYLKYTDMETALASIKRYSQEKYDKELGMVIEELNPNEIIKLIIMNNSNK